LEDLNKIRTMIGLAIYDKKYGKQDRKILSKYRHDYIYLRGLNMRIGVALGVLIIYALYYFYLLITKEGDIFYLINKSTIISIGTTLLIVLAIYTLLCFFKYRKEYNEARNRMDVYEERIERLNKNTAVRGKTYGKSNDDTP